MKSILPLKIDRVWFKSAGEILLENITLRIEKGKQFKVIHELFLGDEFEYNLSNNKINITIRSKERLTAKAYKISVANPILIE